MKIEYDAAHDLLNIEFVTSVPIDDPVEMDGMVIDYVKDKRIVAIEVRVRETPSEAFADRRLHRRR